MGKKLLESEQEQLVAESLWLHYFNQHLYNRGSITDREYKRMIEKIAMRRPLLLSGRRSTPSCPENNTTSYMTSEK